MLDIPDEARNHLSPVSETTHEALDQFAPIYAEEYAGFKEDFLSWLSREGKKPFRGEGYAYDTIKTTHYKIERAYRWKWKSNGEFTKEFIPEDAEGFIDRLVSKTTLADREVRDYIKAIKRLFRWFNETQSAEIDWSYSKIKQLQQESASKRRHYFEQYEMEALYDAAIEDSSIRSYHSVTPAERDRLKQFLAQRFEKPKAEVGPDDFERANSWKFPSLIAMSIDLGLRPIEVGRATTKWLRPSDQKVVIPRSDSSKGENSWECVLSPSATRALKRWLKEREGYEKYADTHKLWLTKYGNPYGSASLNGLLNRLLEIADIEPKNRDLSWYAIRRGSATMWAENSGLEQASEQLRHKKLETTRRYIRSKAESRKNIAADNW